MIGLKTSKSSLTTKTINKSPIVLDLFAGSGGLSEGFVQAGCQIVASIEMDKFACQTLKTRLIYHYLKERDKLYQYKAYITGQTTLDELIVEHNLQNQISSVICETISDETYQSLINQVKANLNGHNLDFIVGGPPCQAYSYIGRSRDRQNMKDDSRNYLYKYYIKFIEAFKPKIFLFENVPGLITAAGGDHLKNMIAKMEAIDYKVRHKIINAADFGVPQNRKRVILIGWNKDSGISHYPEFKKSSKTYTVENFIGDLPTIKAGGQDFLQKYKNKNKLLEKLGIIDKEVDVLFDHITRTHNDRDLQIYRLAVDLKNNGQNLKYNQLSDDLKTHKNDQGFLDRFKVVSKNSPSHTIVAHISKDGHYYIHPDKTQNRSLSVREAARLQTFPDSYKFEGPFGAKLRQIGNAVPPMLAEVIAKKLCQYL